MKQVIDNLNDFVTHMATNYTTMGFEEVVIFDDDGEEQGHPMCIVADAPALQTEVEAQ